jgi:monoamine oxidase
MDGIPITRRAFLTSIGMTAGAAAMYHAMTALGHAAESRFDGPPVLAGARKGASVLILGAGLAGMSAAYEMRNAGYRVRLLEYQNRPGGRNWTLRGGDTYTELGGAKQTVRFAPGNYFNPGPSRIPYHHRAVLHYCKVLGVPLETFVEFNHNAYIHSSKAFGGKPMRYRDLAADLRGGVSELLGKAINAKQLGAPLTVEDQEKLLEALRGWGALDSNFAYQRGLKSSTHRGYERPPGAGVDGAPVASEIIPLPQLLDPAIWGPMNFLAGYNFQTTMFQPVGGIDMIGKGFARHLKDLITYNAKVTKLSQHARGVTATFQDTVKGTTTQAKADWCICTLPLPILAQMDLQVSKEMLAVFQAVPYTSYNRIGIEFRRRFWEEDDAIYGGFTSTDLDIQTIHYPNDRFHSSGPAVMVAAYPNRPGNGVRFTSMTPAERIEAALAQGEQIHPQYRKEYMNGVAVSWHRVPWNLGCRARWTEETRKEHYGRLVEIDGRVAFAGDSVSYLQGWMEGALLSSLDAIRRVHQRAVES